MPIFQIHRNLFSRPHIAGRDPILPGCSYAWLFLLLLPFLVCSASAQTLTLSNQNIPGVWAGSVSWGDYDGDGDFDLLLTGLTGPEDSCIPITSVFRNDGGTLTNIGGSITGIYLGAATWGDYDGDGDLDIALSGLTEADTGSLQIFLNDEGRFSEDVLQDELSPLRYSDIAWADHDRDGDLDLIVNGMTPAGNTSTALYANERINGARIGSPLGSRAVLKLDSPNTARLINLNQGSVSWGDIDGDGDPDLAMSGFGSGGTRQTVVYINQVDGTLGRDDRNPDLSPVSSGDLAWGDMDNDGDLDLAVSGWNNEWEATLQVYKNTAGILRENSISATRVIGALDWADVDADGDLDLGVSGQTSVSDRMAFILRNNLGGMLQEDTGLGLTGLRGGDFSWVDLTADGGIDVLVTGEDENGVRSSNLYSGSLTPTNQRPSAPTQLSRPIVTGSGVVLSWNDGTDGETASTGLSYTLRIGREENGHDAFSGAMGATSGNVGNSRTIELAIPLARDTYYWSVRATDGGLVSSPEASEQQFRVDDLVSSVQSLRPLQNSTMSWGDYDNDGDADLALAGRDVDGISRGLVYRNDSGILSENSSIGLQGVQDGSLAWGDLDNDGDLDLALTGGDQSGNRYTHLYRNRLESNDFAVTLNSVENLPQLAASHVGWGDYDNDGDLDLALMGNIPGDRVAGIFRNEGGSFSQDTSQVMTGLDNGHLAWGDYDNDGDLDLVTTGQSDNQGNSLTVLYQNSSGGILLVDERSSLPGLLVSGVSWGDLDSDGDLDLGMTGLANSGFLTSVYINNGTGVLTDAGVNLSAAAASELAWGDFDNDGDMDLALSGQAATGRVLQVYRNQSGAFDPVPMDVLLGVDFSTVTWVDYDNDFDLDLVSSGRATLDNVTFLPITRANDNLESRFNPNRLPNIPENPAASTQGSQVTLSWSPSSDLNSTPDHAITYALRVGTEAEPDRVVSGSRSVGHGAIRKSTHVLQGLESGNYIWAVRAIDNGLASSDWSTQHAFIVDTIKPVVDSVDVQPRALGSANRITVVVTFQDEPAGMDNTVSPTVTLKLTSGENELPVRQLNFSGNLWIGETDVANPFPSGTVVVSVSGAMDSKANEMDRYQTVVPALVLPGTGAVIESGDGIVSLTVFPSLEAGDLSQNPSISITPIELVVTPEVGNLVGRAYEIVSTPAFTPNKAATLAFKVSTADPNFAIFRLEGSTWNRLGGTFETPSNRVRVPVSQMGIFGLFQESASGSGNAAGIEFSNRAFSPRSSGKALSRLAGSPLFATTDISFGLGSSATVRIEIYNRNGQLQRILESGRQLGPGRHVVTWDGKDEDQKIVRSGLYIVVIDAGGSKSHKTVAVVND